MNALRPAFTWLANVRVQVAEPVELGRDLLGARRVVPIVGGEVTGEWTGRIRPGGADWQTTLDDGTVRIAARYPVQLDGLGAVCFEVRGVRRPADAQFCTTLRMSGWPHGSWGATTFVTVGTKEGDEVAYDLYAVDASDALDAGDPVVSEHRFTIEVDLLPPITTTSTAAASALAIPIVGGRVVGPALSGEVVPLGADWAVERSSGELDVHAQYLIRAADGALIAVDNVGHWREREPDAPYFVTSPVFVADRPEHHWLNCGVFVAPAIERSITRVDLSVFEVSPGSADPPAQSSGSVADRGE